MIFNHTGFICILFHLYIICFLKVVWNPQHVHALECIFCMLISIIYKDNEYLLHKPNFIWTFMQNNRRKQQYIILLQLYFSKKRVQWESSIYASKRPLLQIIQYFGRVSNTSVWRVWVLRLRPWNLRWHGDFKRWYDEEPERS